MKKLMTCCIALGLLWALVGYPLPAYGGSDAYENLEFFLERALKQTEDSDRRLEILNQYLIKVIGLLYQQNQEMIRLNRESIGVLQNILRLEQEEKRELESQLRELQNQLPRR